MNNTEAIQYFKENQRAKFPFLSRANSIIFIESLYKNGAIAVEIPKARDLFVVELIIKTDNNARDVLNQIFKANPHGLEEVKPKVFRMHWKV